ncbi:Zn-ribbon domain-containing OB-fold protein [Nocardioides sp. cx-173]|uniref:Zn-ribbon domain-containing OB-fold protein n=1 Tax=Nocardioides sp. cx-173 TaxID=2898796 RepID=UPI001E5086FE|nr:OB-fold nucleic acid binding domain-containing protein [Nocardioides sp. cx-173]MCD4525934.1 OB-fold domain-containing protein [Nocardioides sp. cx-173]UGB40085.1 OB-fold domain-containing protein [Nocardioides sp. cx-173]
MSRTLSAPVTVAFDYTRSTGPVLGRFLTGLRDGVLVGARTSQGEVVVPPLEYDPVTHEQTADFVEVEPVGTVTSWSWVPEPVAGQPFDRPFAFALVTLDGATRPMLHAVDVASPAEIRTGMRVQVRWAEERVGHITDIACFEPEAGRDEGADGATELSRPGEADADGGFEAPFEARGLAPQDERSARTSTTEGDVTGVVTPVSLDYVYAASPEESTFYRGLDEGRILAQRCPTCDKVYVPPRSACPTDGTPTEGEVELSGLGTITTFCIVNVPFLGQKIAPPYVSAYVLLDGADIALLHLILGVPADEVRMGMRVEAVWKPREEWAYSLENIDHFAPTGDPDADYDTYQRHL